jgi:hypothetical protein
MKVISKNYNTGCYNERATCLTTSAMKDFAWLGLDDCSILHPRHLIRSRLGETHDSFSVQNLSISQSRGL